MQHIASILKSEIARIARKEIRAEVDSLKKVSGHYRTTIASLKREVLALEKKARQLSKGLDRQPPAESRSQSVRKHRFSAKRLAANRDRLGLSAHAYGALIGVSGQSIYKWEAQKSRPRQSQLQALASIQGLGKREAAKRLADMESNTG